MTENNKRLFDDTPGRRLLLLLVAVIVAGLVTLVGVIFWFKPIAEADRAGTFVPPAAVSLAIYCGLSVVLYDWAVRRCAGYWTAAFIIGAAQAILVIDLTLRGDRGLATAGAGTALIFVTWASIAFVYRVLAPGPPEPDRINR